MMVIHLSILGFIFNIFSFTSNHAILCSKNITEEEHIMNKIGRIFGIIQVYYGIIIMLAVLDSNGGISGNIRVVGTAVLLIYTGIFSIIGMKNSGAFIASKIFYIISIIYNILNSYEYHVHLSVAGILFIFLIISNICSKPKK